MAKMLDFRRHAILGQALMLSTASGRSGRDHRPDDIAEVEFPGSLGGHSRDFLKSSTPASLSGGTLVMPRDVIRAQHELALKAASFETAVRLGNLIQ